MMLYCRCWIIIQLSLLLLSSSVNSDTCELSVLDVLGPYFLANAPWKSTVCDESDPQFTQDRLKVSGYVMGKNCKGVEGATVDIWQAASDGTYDPNESLVQGIYQTMKYDYTSPNGNKDDYKCRSRVRTNSKGAFEFETVLPGLYWPRPLHLHYRVTSSEKTSVHQMYFDYDTNRGKVPQLTAVTVQKSDHKSAVFNFTIDVDGTYDFSTPSDSTIDNSTQIDDTDTEDVVDNGKVPDNFTDDLPNKDTEEEGMVCYMCSSCPDPFDTTHSSVSLTQCPPNGCKTWRNTNSKTWNRGCFLSSECQPSDAAYEATCCTGSKCNNNNPSHAQCITSCMIMITMFLLVSFSAVIY